MMSDGLADMTCCANCGKVEVDDVKLKICTACRLVKYCSVECQKTHRPQHKKACKKKAAEIRDNRLFTQPDESYLGECPICFLPLSLDLTKSNLMSCCSQKICMGCASANMKSEIEEGLENRCAFCREPLPITQEEGDNRGLERIKKICPVAMREMGKTRFNEGDYDTAFKYYTNAAELGDAEAHHFLSLMYHYGNGIENDTKKARYHAEQAAIAGHDKARYNLGAEEMNDGKFDRAVKHFIIAANLGESESLKCLKLLYTGGDASKEDYADALRACQAALEATKSSEREKAEEDVKNGKLVGPHLYH